MRRLLARSLSLAVAFNGSIVFAQSQPEVIARSSTAVSSKASPTQQVTYRAQMDDRPAPPPIIQDTPLHSPMPAPLGPIASSTVTTTGPVTTTVGPTFGPTVIDSQGPPVSGIVFSAMETPNRWYITGEYLYWWTRNSGTPALVTTGPVTDPVPGVLDPVIGPNTQVTYGNDASNNQGRSGGRFEIGRWIGPCRLWAIEGGFFFLGEQSSSFQASGNGLPGSPIIARPFFESNRNLENVEYINFPGVLAGAIDIQTSTNFYGANIDLRRKLWCRPCFRLDGQVGFRYLHLDDEISISERSNFVAPGFVTNTGAPIPVGTTSAVQDIFKTTNDFYGGMFGLVSEWQRGRWTIQLAARCSIGTTQQRVEISGGQQIVPANLAPPGSFNSGLLTRPTNIGVYEQNNFAVVPEAAFNVGYQFTPHWKVFMGYTFMYWSNVARAGDQIDRTVNLNGIPFALQPGQTDNLGRVIPAGDARPAPVLRDTDFWAQGINAGLQWTW